MNNISKCLFQNYHLLRYYVLSNYHYWKVFTANEENFGCVGFLSENDALEYLLKKLVQGAVANPTEELQQPLLR